MQFWSCKTGLRPLILYFSKAILLLWFYLFYGLVLKVCNVCTLCFVFIVLVKLG